MFHLGPSDPARRHVEQLLADARTASGPVDRRVQVVADGPGYTVRRITLAAGEELPFRRNPNFAKTWRVTGGRGHADVAETDLALMEGAQIDIAPGALHQIENRGEIPLVLHELRVAIGLDAAGAAMADAALEAASLSVAAVEPAC